MILINLFYKKLCESAVHEENIVTERHVDMNQDIVFKLLNNLFTLGILST